MVPILTMPKMFCTRPLREKGPIFARLTIHVIVPSGLVLTNLEERTYFDILPVYRLKALETYFRAMPDRHKVEVVAMDLSNLFEMVIRKHFPKAVIVADKYHVVRMANEAVEAVNRKVRRDLPKGERLALFRRRGVVSSRASRLDTSGQELLEEITARYPLLATAHRVKEELYAIYDAPTRADAALQMDRWLSELPVEIAPYFRGVTNALTSRREHILNYFQHRYTNAFTEAANGISKLLQRRGKRYGFEVLRLKLLYGKKAMKIKEEQFVVAEEEEDRGTMRDMMRFMAASPTRQKKVITRKTLVGPEFTKVADLAEHGYYESDEVEPHIEAALRRFAETY